MSAHDEEEFGISETTKQPQTTSGDGDGDGEDVCRSLTDAESFKADGSALVYDPRVVERPKGVLEIWAREENPDVVPWGFWGGVVSAIAAAIILFRGSTSQLAMWDVLLVTTALLVGLALFKLGKRSALEERMLCELDTRHGFLSWPTSDAAAPIAVAFEDIEELAFAAVSVPVKDSRAGTHLDAVSVRILDHRGKELPIVEASTSKAEAHRIARLLADLLGMSVEYVGTGVREWV